MRCNIIFGPNVLNMYANCILDRITFGHDISLCLCNVVQVCQYGSCLFDYIYIYILRVNVKRILNNLGGSLKISIG